MMRIQPKLRAASAEWHNTGTMFGLIQAAVDGTTLEEWSPPASLALCAKKPTLIKDRESQHYNGMIAPLVGFSLKMALCELFHTISLSALLLRLTALLFGAGYQGEADAGPQARNSTPGDTRCADGLAQGCDFVDAYACRFSAMINTWRDLWGMGDYAFIFAQLAPVPGARMGWPQFGGNWPGLRLQQAGALPAPGSVVDTSGMAVITDLGDTLGPPHPKNKTEVGRRLALQALHVAYAYQSLGNASASSSGLSVDAGVGGIPPGAALAQLPYDGFADGPLLQNASLTSGGVTLLFHNAEGMALRPTHGCGQVG
jgi:hypothetical protein